MRLNYLIKTSCCISLIMMHLAQSYVPLQLDSYLASTIETLTMRKNALDTKIALYKARLSLKKQSKKGSPSTRSQLITNNSKQFLANLTAQEQALAKRILLFTTEKNNLAKLNITSPTQEHLLIQQQTIANRIEDLKQHILQALQTEAFLDKQKKGKTDQEMKLLNQLKKNQVARRQQFEIKLLQEKTNLKKLTNLKKAPTKLTRKKI